MFHMRANGSAICTRTIHIDNKAEQLNSAFCYIVRAPFRYVADTQSPQGKVYVWIGNKSDPAEHDLCADVARELVNKNNEFPLEILREGEEPSEFWDALGGQKDYPKDADFMQYSRLFRCTNEKGFFCVSEKTVDFCQEDLDDDDIMMLDNGEQVFLWVGSHASEVEIKLAYKAVQVYVQHLRVKQPERPRKLMVTVKGKETKRFTKCFHAWGKHKLPAGD
uniref:Gelsolin-like domain-containing protein n=1 Tax=Plectus sambesii TaxID=2011161 RepID=A0A914W203_9BILA